MITRDTWKRGFKNGLSTSWMLLKIIVPVYAAVTILGYTPVLGWCARVFEPVMGLAGLPGETAVAFVTGALVNIYAAIGIIIALNMTPLQITTIAIMINICHELIVESAVLKRAGVRVWPVLTLRIFGAFLAGGLMNAYGHIFF